MGWQREQYDWLHRHGGDLDAAFLNACRRDSCPRCGSGRIQMYGHDRRGVRRWRCAACGTTLAPATGTIFEDRRLPVTAWAEFLLAIMSFESLAGIARRDRRSPTTPAYQLAKLFMVLDGIQDAVVLSGRVQADEMMYPVPAADRDPLLAGRRAGGHPRNSTCIAIACEEGSTARRSSASWGSASRARSVPRRRTVRTCPAASCSSTTGRTRTTPWCGSSGS
jgi:ribosomal protein S27AE